MPKNYWMVTTPPQHFDASREQGFTLLGFGRAHQRKVQRIEVGDRVLFFVMGREVFGATATAKSTYFEEREPLWPSDDPEEVYPFRVRIHPDVVLAEAQYVDARLIAPRMDYVRKWTPERWYMAFHGPLHLIPKRDFALLEDEMRKLSDGARPAPGHSPGPTSGAPIQGARRGVIEPPSGRG